MSKKAIANLAFLLLIGLSFAGYLFNVQRALASIPNLDRLESREYLALRIEILFTCVYFIGCEILIWRSTMYFLSPSNPTPARNVVHGLLIAVSVFAIGYAVVTSLVDGLYANQKVILGIPVFLLLCKIVQFVLYLRAEDRQWKKQNAE